MSGQKSKVPHRQIRAVFDADTVTVYQAYSVPIANAAVAAQQLDASPLFNRSRMTWIKPSWCWMMYRAGYSLKDPGQARILRLRITRAGFEEMLRASEDTHAPDGDRNRAQDYTGPKQTQDPQHLKSWSVRVQWDPDRGPRLQRYEYRSIQIGVSVAFIKRFVKEWIVQIEDVTDQALALKTAVDRHDAISTAQLMEQGLVPAEAVYPTPEEIALALGMHT